MALNPALLDRGTLGRLAPQAGPLGRRAAGLRAGAAFAGPAFLVSIGYMDPGNWGTDLAAGSRFGYRLLWVLVAANLTAVMLQYLSAKLGIATGQDLASAIGSRLRPGARIGYWLVAEGAMLATEMAEFIGVVVALRLLFGLALAPAIALGAVLVLSLLASRSMRRIERVIFLLLAVIGGVYALEVILARPALGPIAAGATMPSLDAESLPIAVGILGAVVMPHNLFLHSGLIRSRCGTAPARRVLRRSTVETVVALNLALLVNGAILIMAAATFGRHGVAVDSLGQAHQTLQPMLGRLAAGGFALALLASGLASSTTGSLAGQLVLDGLLGWRVPALARRAATMIPAVIVLAVGVNEVAALVWSQVALSLALPAVAIPLVALTSRRDVMGSFANRAPLRRLATAVVALLVVLNLVLLVALLG
jgi:manganese transport protein